MACKTTIKPIAAVYKQALKVLDKKPKMYHHCYILEKYERLNLDNIVKYMDSVLVSSWSSTASATRLRKKKPPVDQPEQALEAIA